MDDRRGSSSVPHSLGPQLVVGLDFTQLSTRVTTRGFSPGLLWASSQHSSWVPEGSSPRGQDRNAWHFYNLDLKTTVTFIILCGPNYKIPPRFKGRAHEPHHQWEQCHDHIIEKKPIQNGRYCEMYIWIPNLYRFFSFLYDFCSCSAQCKQKFPNNFSLLWGSYSGWEL